MPKIPLNLREILYKSPISLPPKTLWEEYCDKWSNGCNYSTCPRASSIVLCRGKIPSDICFVGEAPGESEDTLGIPFIGVAGKLLDQIISEALPDWVRYSLTNIVACIPRAESGSVEEPEWEHMIACQPRLVEFLNIADPKIIVCVGTKSRDWFDGKAKHHIKLHREYLWGERQIPHNSKYIRMVDIVHPAFMLRQNEVIRSFMVRQAGIKVHSAVSRAVEDGILKMPDDREYSDETQD